METPPRRATTPLCQIERPRARVQLVEIVVTVTRMLTNHHGRDLVLMQLQTHTLSTETGPEVSTTETDFHLYDVRMTATVLLAAKSNIHLMKRGGNLTHIARSHTTTHVTATTTGTDITITQAETVLIGPPQGLQDFPQRTDLWTVRAQAIGSPMILTLVVLVTVMPHPLEMTALAVFYEGMIILLMILLKKVLGIMVIQLAVVLGQQNVLGTPNPSAGAPTPSSCGILTPRIRVQVDHRL
jgi:hypothetical protein